MPESYILLAKPDMDISTRYMKALIQEKIIERPDIDAMIKAINEGSLAKIGENLSNVLEYVTVKMSRAILDIKAKLLEYGALGSVASSSG